MSPRGGTGEGARDTGVLPLLSHALYATWSQALGRRLTIADYRKVGGIHGAVAATADAVYHTLTEHQRDLARQLFISLVQVSADAADTRRRLLTAELLSASPVAPADRHRPSQSTLQFRLLFRTLLMSLVSKGRCRWPGGGAHGWHSSR
ncbi:hypothetical protein [Micromonosporaceae bacterium CPCC 204380]|uniref:nSTAND1 domain-containing NTPase n=1 Tax=Allorhizocola rhizosphaerae TaxID=1872709 RepID=UPI000E3D782D